MHKHSEANAKWKDLLDDFRQSNSYRELFGIDREPIELEWTFQGLTKLEILHKIQDNLDVRKIIPEQFEDRIIFMSIFNDVDRTKRGNSDECFSNSEQVKNCAKRLPRGHWSFLGPGKKEKWHGTHTHKSEGKWNSIAAEMVEHFKESGHPFFRGISALNRGVRKRKGGRRFTSRRNP